jgi:hypothetical protein
MRVGLRHRHHAVAHVLKDVAKVLAITVHKDAAVVARYLAITTIASSSRVRAVATSPATAVLSAARSSLSREFSIASHIGPNDLHGDVEDRGMQRNTAFGVLESIKDVGDM